MHIGVCRLSLRIPGNDNLKGKRRAIHSLASRIRSKFNVSIAEIEDLESWQRITLGVTCVSNDGRHANSMISNVVRYVEKIRGEVEILDYEVEILDGL
ncbi:MAG: DUF503 domain-containing protein [Dehalococcoidia bacterium]